jgi:HD-GYP domain-containing protein (c-di-GMP phosphodiesterase class II)
MFTPEPPLKFPPAEQAIADRLLKIVPEIDRLEGYSQPHAIAVARLSETLARQLDLRGHDLTALLLAALAHDIGERTMKRNYLLREDALSWEETLDLWRHPILGEQQSAELNLPRQAQLLIRWHHESWNGEGYPDALAGEAIPLGARILRVADTWCALTADRPYRAAIDPLEAEEIIAEQAGIELDPLVVQIMLDLFEAERASEESQDTELPLGTEPGFELEEEMPVYEVIGDLEAGAAGEPAITITEDPIDEPPVELPTAPATEQTALSVTSTAEETPPTDEGPGLEGQPR